MRPYLRYLRIGWTGLCVLAAVLLIALWVRSYWRFIGVHGMIGSRFVIVET